MNELKLDYDGELDLERLASRMSFVEYVMQIEFEDMKVYRTARGWHVYASYSENIPDHQAVCIQALLGSDWVRELYNLRRVSNGVSGWNILFRMKKKLGKDETFETFDQDATDILHYHHTCEFIRNFAIETIVSVNAAC